MPPARHAPTLSSRRELVCHQHSAGYGQDASGMTFQEIFSMIAKGNYYVYITTNPGKTVLYTGVTNDLKLRLQQHYQNRGNKRTFAGRYYCYRLIYFETYTDINQAIAREKEIKDWAREKKEALIATKNPKWNFLKP
jgi:putative endonuclease